MASLPSDLVKEIMSRVPGKSLARFRTVSNQFRSLLCDPCLLRLHCSRSRDSFFTLKTLEKINVGMLVMGCFFDLNNMIRQRWYSFHVTNKVNDLVHVFTLTSRTSLMRMLSSYHQFVCCATLTEIYLYDPLNNALKRLPDIPQSSWCYNYSSNECLVSFGFVEATLQYKVVKWPHDLEEESHRTRNDVKFELLSIDVNVEDGCLTISPWRNMATQCPYLLQLSSQVHVNGYIYWTTSDFQIVSFSLQDMTFSSLNPNPPPCFRSQKSHVFKLSGSRRNLWMIDYDVSSQTMEIWKMEESGWANVHRVDMRGIHQDENDGELQMLDIQAEQVLFKGIDHEDFQLCHYTDGPFSLHTIHV